MASVSEVLGVPIPLGTFRSAERAAGFLRVGASALQGCPEAHHCNGHGPMPRKLAGPAAGAGSLSGTSGGTACRTTRNPRSTHPRYR